jgi:hypothetical protein
MIIILRDRGSESWICLFSWRYDTDFTIILNFTSHFIGSRSSEMIKPVEVRNFKAPVVE